MHIVVTLPQINDMKKVIPFVLALCLFTGCIDVDPIVVTTSSTLVESVAIIVPQTNGTAHTTDETVSQDLSDIISNLGDINDITIEEVRYTFKNVIGNPAAVIQNASLVVNGVTIASPSNVNITQEANNATVFTITDPTILDQLANFILTQSAVTLQYTSTTLSDDGSIRFDVEVSVDISATL